MAHRFAGLGTNGKKVYLYKKSGAKLKKARQILWGDYLRIDETAMPPEGMLAVKWSQGPDLPPLEYYVKIEETTGSRPLEAIFLDVGQGDGSIVIGPGEGEDERIIIVDAGIGDNMDRFLASRFKYKSRGFHVHAAVITHPDKDHYNGFQSIFENGNLKVKHLFHNGLREQHRSMGPRLGDLVKSEAGPKYHIDLLHDDADMRAYCGPGMDPAMDRMLYPGLLHTAINNDVAESYTMLGKVSALAVDTDTDIAAEDEAVDPRHSWMPGLSPADGTAFTVEVLGPIVDRITVNEPGHRAHGKRALGLRRITNDGKTKNGHSVLLRLSIGNFTLMLGGDLNKASERLILQSYAGMESWPKTNEDRARMVASARVRLRSDLLKVCHHGSSDVTDEFIQAVDPAAFIVSSGDEEGHVHPRPDLLGRLGRNGRGFAPLILSTELQRSTREKEDQKDKAAIEKSAKILETRTGTKASDVKAREKAKLALSEALARLSRDNVSVYGAIHVKTDGEKLIVAFKKETSSLTSRWFYYEYQQDANGTLLPLHEVTL